MVASLVSRLDRNRFQPAIATLFDASPGDLESEAGVPVHRLGKRPGLDIRMFGRLRRVINQFRPDLVHTHSYVLRYVLPVARSPIVHTVHNLADREVDTVGRGIHRIAFRLGVTPVAVSESVANSFESMYGFRPQLIYNGIDLSQFGRPRQKDTRPFTVLSVARLEPQKNPQLLIEACSALTAPAEVLIAGEGSLRPHLERNPEVRLLGVRSDIPELMANSDVFALSSDYEGHPVALLEAMAAGLPVVATAVGGVPEIVGDAGLLVPPRNIEAFRTALRNLQLDPNLREQLSRRARERARSFGVDTMVDSYSALYDRLVEHRA